MTGILEADTCNGFFKTFSTNLLNIFENYLVRLGILMKNH